MSTTPTATDADLILKLYDLRREPEMRKARNWWLAFWPESSDDVMKIGMALGTQENAWLRQVTGYWELAASFVLHGTLSRDLFLEGSFSGEMFLLFAKIEPFLKDVREKMHSPNVFGNVEKVIMTSKGGPERLKETQERLAIFKKAAQAAKAA
ncbi:MAG: hypothetical protein JOZ80_05180 [Acidobacteriaceae bacterium]|nr:hypothetical protein [Acidobacteriaceae bacterium]